MNFDYKIFGCSTFTDGWQEGRYWTGESFKERQESTEYYDWNKEIRSPQRSGLWWNGLDQGVIRVDVKYGDNDFSSRIPVLKLKTPSTDSYYGGKDCGGVKYSQILRVYDDPKNPGDKFHISLKDCGLEPKWYERFVRDVLEFAHGKAMAIVDQHVPGLVDSPKYICQVAGTGGDCGFRDFNFRLDEGGTMVIVFTLGKGQPVAVSLDADSGSKGRWFGKSISYNDIPKTGTGDKLIVVYHWGKMATAMIIP